MKTTSLSWLSWLYNCRLTHLPQAAGYYSPRRVQVAEHTLPAKALAYAMKPDYIEQDVVMTKDDQLVVLHGRIIIWIALPIFAERFPDRAREDGRYYAIDFTLAEIKSLRVTEGFKLDEQGNKVAGYQHASSWQSDFSTNVCRNRNDPRLE